MQPTADFDPARLARSLLRRSRQGALATLMAGSGDPYCSLVNVASHPDGSPILLISRLALHTRNILADSRVSLMLDERAEGDPLEGARIMLAGRAEEVSQNDAAIFRRRYLSAHPSAETFVDFKDFSFFRIRPSGTHLVAGFGRIIDLQPEQFLSDLGGAEGLKRVRSST
jgi:putative heme iron utilization protein